MVSLPLALALAGGAFLLFTRSSGSSSSGGGIPYRNPTGGNPNTANSVTPFGRVGATNNFAGSGAGPSYGATPVSRLGVTPGATRNPITSPGAQNGAMWSPAYGGDRDSMSGSYGAGQATRDIADLPGAAMAVAGALVGGPIGWAGLASYTLSGQSLWANAVNAIGFGEESSMDPTSASFAAAAAAGFAPSAPEVSMGSQSAGLGTDQSDGGDDGGDGGGGADG